jgi:2'-5' RNA ligase
VDVVHRLLFALQPHERARRRIARHRDALEGVISAVTNGRLHLTLAITGDYEEFPAAEAHRLHGLGESIVAEPVAVSLERVAASKRSVALRPGRSSRELRALQKPLSDGLASAGLLRPGWKFGPHVTVAYREGEPFAHPIEPIVWEAHEFVLIHSEVGATRHHVLGRWPLFWRQGRLFDAA